MYREREIDVYRSSCVIALMCVYIYIYIYIYICICTHIRTYTYTHIHIHLLGSWMANWILLEYAGRPQHGRLKTCAGSGFGGIGFNHGKQHQVIIIPLRAVQIKTLQLKEDYQVPRQVARPRKPEHKSKLTQRESLGEESVRPRLYTYIM